MEIVLFISRWRLAVTQNALIMIRGFFKTAFITLLAKISLKTIIIIFLITNEDQITIGSVIQPRTLWWVSQSQTDSISLLWYCIVSKVSTSCNFSLYVDCD